MGNVGSGIEAKVYFKVLKRHFPQFFSTSRPCLLAERLRAKQGWHIQISNFKHVTRVPSNVTLWKSAQASERRDLILGYFRWLAGLLLTGSTQVLCKGSPRPRGTPARPHNTRAPGGTGDGHSTDVPSRHGTPRSGKA